MFTEFIAYYRMEVVQLVKNLLAMQETQVWSLGLEDPPEKTNDNPFEYFYLGNPWTEEPGGLQSTGLQELDMT